MEQVMEENSQLRTEVEGNLQQRNILSRELEEMRGQLQAMASENRKMDVEVQALRQSLQVYVTYLPTGKFGLLL
jgi:regulator of replication initiation timing